MVYIHISTAVVTGWCCFAKTWFSSKELKNPKAHVQQKSKFWIFISQLNCWWMRNLQRMFINLVCYQPWGLSNTTNHMKTRRHTSEDAAPASIPKIRSYFKTIPKNDCGACAPAESVFPCHSVKCDFSLTSNDRSSSLLSPTLESEFPLDIWKWSNNCSYVGSISRRRTAQTVKGGQFETSVLDMSERKPISSISDCFSLFNSGN